MSSTDRPAATHPVRRASGRVRAAAAPIAVAGAVALSVTVGFSPAPAAAADRVQQRLVAEGYLASGDASGSYDARTGAAVARWQAARGLRADGLVDVVTADTLLGTGPTIPQRRTPA